MTPSELPLVAVLVLTLVLQGRETFSAVCPTNCFNCDDKGSCINCNSGWYGEDCSSQCRRECPGSCDKGNGHCTICHEGKYGDYCSKECHSNCIGIRCNIKNGRCEDGCKAGFHGDFCNFPCGKCSSGVCSQGTGFCDRCLCGWTGNRCNISCDQSSSSCKVCGSNGVEMPSTTMTSTTSELWSTSAKPTILAVTRITRTSRYDSVEAISIGAFLLVVLVLTITGCTIAYWKHWLCFQKTKQPKPSEEPMYHSDAFGSPTISRSHLTLNKQDNTTMEEEDEE
ncbi:scavenger receptor class F member 1-like [Haliotis asinina]|uniref:scavenger receptor class F member 1-like n=1 Tax=Haliotis asinina TaxID=109174 RepID=UPI0035320C92